MVKILTFSPYFPFVHKPISMIGYVETDVLIQFVEDELGEPSKRITYRLKRSQPLEVGLLEGARSGISGGEEKQAYDLIVRGASKEMVVKRPALRFYSQQNRQPFCFPFYT